MLQGGLLAGGAALLPTPPAQAEVAVRTASGKEVAAMELNMALRVCALRGSVPGSWVSDLKEVLGGYAGFGMSQRPQIQDIYQELQKGAAAGRKSAAVADAVTLGDRWLGPAIKANLVQPIQDAAAYKWWHRLDPRWQSLLRRDAAGRVSASGQVYAAPYRWGCLMVAVRSDKLLQKGGRPVEDWADLLQPRLRGRIALPASPQEFVSIVLKLGGLGVNATASQVAGHSGGLPALQQRSRDLKAAARLVSGEEHTRALQAGDVWAAVGWSHDLIALAERTSTVRLATPASGTVLSADVWAVPAYAQGGSMQSGPSPLLPLWLDFCLAPARADEQQGLLRGASPLLLPPRCDAAQAVCDPPVGAGPAGSWMPTRDMPLARSLQLSDFAVPPPDQATFDMYNAIIAA